MLGSLTPKRSAKNLLGPDYLYDAPMATRKKSLYEILGVSRDANSIDLGRAYQKALAAAERAVPPDPTHQALIAQAQEILLSPDRRAAYDASLVTAAEKEAAKEQAGAPDLDLGGDEEASTATRKLPWLPIVGALVIVAIGAFFTFRSTPVPEQRMADAPKTVAPIVPPAPLKPRTSAEILTMALPSVGRVMSYDMSGRMTPVGLALAVEQGAMVTTCEGVVAGTQLVVKLGAESHSANLLITDETLGLCKLSVPGVTLKSLVVAAEEPQAGDTIHALGANDKGDMALTQGTVKKITSTPSGRMLEVSMPISATGSGGAIFDNFGRVVGVATLRAGAGASAALPTSALAEMRSRTRN